MKAWRWFLALAMVLPLALGGCDKKKSAENKPEPMTAPDKGGKAEPGKEAAAGTEAGKEGGKEGAAPAAPNPADKFVDDAITAAGGLDKLKAAGSFTAKGKGAYMGMAYTSTIQRGPAAMAMEIKGEGMEMTMVAGVEQCWTKMGPAVIPCTKDEAATYRKQIMFENAAMLLPLKEKDHWELKLGEGDLNGKKADTLTVKAKGSDDEGVVYFDKESKNPVRISFQATMMGKQGEMAIDILETQDVGGVKMPAKMKDSFGGELVSEETVSDIKFGPVDDKVFAQPPQVADGTTVEITTPAMTTLCYTHKGAYDGFGAAMEKMMAFMKDKKIPPFGPPMMVYLKSPPAVKDPKKFVTELCFPVSPKAKVDKKAEFVIKPMKPMKAMAMFGVGDVTKHSGEIIDKLMKELKTKKKKPAGPVSQICFTDPKEYPPEQQVFEMAQPVK